MDPLGFAASIIAVLGAAKAGYKALEKIHHTRKAPGGVSDLLDELGCFKALLEEITELVDPQRGLQGDKHLQDLVQRGGKIVGDINTLTAQTWPSIHFFKLSEANRQRVTVLKDGGKLKTLKDNLRIIHFDLVAGLSIVSVSSSVRLGDDIAATTKLHQSNSAALSTLLQKVTFIEESALQLQEATGMLAMPIKEYNSIVSRLDLADSGHSVPRFPYLAQSWAPDAIDDGPRRASDPSSDLLRQQTDELRRCVDWCSCRCHTQSVSEFPWILKTFLGQLFIERACNGLPCNERRCQRSPASSVNLTYHLPKFLMRRYLKFAMHHHPLHGPNISVRMPRVMEWQHELFKHAVAGDVRAIQSLFSEGKASPFDVNPRGCNALIYAAAHGNPELGRFLLQEGADPDLTDSNGRKPVELFAERAFAGQLDHDLVKNMFEGTTFVESRQFTILHKIVLGLIDRDLKGEVELSTAAINDTDAQGRTPLCWATIRDDHSSVETLLAYGAGPNIADHTGSSCLHFARSPHVCQALLNKHADVHARNRMYSRTALHSFCKRDGTVEMIDHLVEAGLEVDARDADGETPLMNAIFRGFTAATEKLVDLGADLNACNTSSHESSIHFAVEFDRYDMLPLLLKKGVDYTARNIRGRTIAHMAARVASARTIEVLSCLDLIDLDLSLKDTDGNTAADYLSSRKIVTDMDVGVRKAFTKLQQTCRNSKAFRGPHLRDIYDIEAQKDLEKQKPCQLPGAFPEPPGQQDTEKEDIWQDTVANFRCDYRSPCCFLFDAPRGVCSGVISYQSDGQVS
ncbi:MAG: hypothetical protein LQ348_001487 [Seirophora lacunosa]|nr:MAG: hypothetical protein LQ348_001487 [Seirophora lacunosa]